MTATEDCSKVTAICLIQPVSYLQYGLAAYPANLSLCWLISEEFNFSSTLLANVFADKDRSLNLSNICT